MHKLTRFLRHNAVGLLALFVALGGTSYAATKLPKNSVGATQIKSGAVTSSELRKGAVKNSDLGSGAVTGSKIKGNSVTSSKVKPGSLLASDLKAGEMPKTLPPNGAAGGSLTGTYPNPGLADGSVTASTLGELPAGRLVRTGSVQSIAANTQAGVVFPSTNYLKGGITTGSDGGTTTLVVPKTGIYTITAGAAWAVTPATPPTNPPAALADDGSGFRTLYIRGSEASGGIRASSTVPAADTTQTRQTVSTTDRFEAGDLVELIAQHNSTAHANLDLRGAQNSLHLSATFVSP